MHAKESTAASSEKLSRSVNLYTDRVRRIWGPRALSLVVYGDAARGHLEHPPYLICSAMVLESIDLDALRLLAYDGPRFGAYQIAAPLVFTPDSLKSACDTFPLELIEIQQQHSVVFGADYFAPLQFEPREVRIQCERELKVMQIVLHQGLLAACGVERHLRRLDRDVAEQLVRTLRGLLWLKAERQAKSPLEVVAAFEKALGDGLPGVYSVVAGKDDSAWHQLKMLYDDVQSLGNWADAFK